MEHKLLTTFPRCSRLRDDASSSCRSFTFGIVIDSCIDVEVMALCKPIFTFGKTGSLNLQKKRAWLKKLNSLYSVWIPRISSHNGHKCWVVTERARSQIQPGKIGFPQRISGATLLDRKHNSEISESFQAEPLLLCFERPMPRYYGHVIRMLQERVARTDSSSQGNWQDTER